jgi:7-cyano-7-deazaguanine synthase in queuosine biosynthesis
MRYSQIDHFWRWQMWIARRNNLMMLYASFAQAQQQLLHVLLGLNHVYYFGFKWLDAINERLIHKPAELLSRLGQIYQVDPAFGAHELAALIEETYDLIEELMPQIDVVWLRTVFRYQRPAWDQEPPYV